MRGKDYVLGTFQVIPGRFACFSFREVGFPSFPKLLQLQIRGYGSLFFLQKECFSGKVNASLVINFSYLNHNFIAFFNDVFRLLYTMQCELGNMNQAFFARKDFKQMRQISSALLLCPGMFLPPGLPWSGIQQSFWPCWQRLHPEKRCKFFHLLQHPS